MLRIPVIWVDEIHPWVTGKPEYLYGEGSDLIGGTLRLLFGEKASKPVDPTVDELIEVIHTDVQERKID